MAELVEERPNFKQRLAVVEKGLSATVSALIDVYGALGSVRALAPALVRDEKFTESMTNLSKELETLIGVLKEIRGNGEQ